MISFCSRVEGRTWASCELFRYASEDELDRRKSVGRSRSRKKIEKENFTDVSDAIAAFHLVFLFFFFGVRTVELIRRSDPKSQCGNTEDVGLFSRVC